MTIPLDSVVKEINKAAEIENERNVNMDIILDEFDKLASIIFTKLKLKSSWHNDSVHLKENPNGLRFSYNASKSEINCYNWDGRLKYKFPIIIIMMELECRVKIERNYWEITEENISYFNSHFKYLLGH